LIHDDPGGPAGSLLRTEGAFRSLLAAAFISGCGDQFNRVAVVSTLVLSTGSSVAVAGGLVLRIAMQLAFGPVGAALADRFPRKTILLGADFGRALIALVFLATVGGGHERLLYGAIAALEILSALFMPARSAVIPTLVRPSHTNRANALDQSATGLVMAVGSLTGGIVVAGLGTAAAFVLNSASFAASGLIIMGLDIPRVRREAARRIGTRLRDVWPVIRRSPRLRLVLVLFATWPLAGGALSVLIPAYASKTFHQGASLGIGALYGALGVGYLLGGVVAVRIDGWARPRAAWIAALSFVVEGAFYALAAAAPGLWWACGCMALATTAAGLGNTAESTVVMDRAPAEALGRIFGLAMTVSSLSQITAMLTAGLVLTQVEPRAVGLCAGALLVGLGVAVCGGLAAEGSCFRLRGFRIGRPGN
jgi:predicted MFS family arabinose efflux permease